MRLRNVIETSSKRQGEGKEMNVNTRKRNVLIAILLAILLAAGILYESSNHVTFITTTLPAKTDKVAIVALKAPVAPVVAPTPAVSVKAQATLKVTAPAKVVSTPAPKVSVKATVVKTIVTPKPIKVTVPKGSTVITKTKSGTQTLTVNTDKVKVTITPTVAGNPTPVATNGSNDVAPSAPLPASDWSGFVAPKVTFNKMLSCVKSASKEVSPLTGALAYNFTIVEQLKLTGGHFNYEGKTYNPSDVLYVSYTPYTLSTNSMDLSMGMPDSAELYFSPFNWKTNGGGPAGGGVSDFGPDASYKMIDFTYIFHSTQAECDSLPKP